MVYKKINGSIFTIKNFKEKKAFIEYVNDSNVINNVFECVDTIVDQFSGKITALLMKMKDDNKSSKIYRFNVMGNYPSLSITSTLNPSNTFIISFPNFQDKDEVDKKVIRYTNIGCQDDCVQTKNQPLNNQEINIIDQKEENNLENEKEEINNNEEIKFENQKEEMNNSEEEQKKEININEEQTQNQSNIVKMNVSTRRKKKSKFNS